MRWKTTILSSSLLLLLTAITPTTALRTTRVTTTFTPTCPNPSPAINPADLDLNESFSISLTIRSGICQPVPVPLPLPYPSEVDHVFVSASRVQGHQGVLRGTRREWEWRKGGQGAEEEKCVVRLWESPGCLGDPLIVEEVRGSLTEEASECRERKFPALNEVFVRIDCVREESKKEKEKGGVHHPKLHAPAFGKYSKGTTARNSTSTLMRRRQWKRWSAWRA
ncbi:hypothetical protein BJY00DRAFT_224344 [Aspergillus carlsbadensis]|nr:hypothetical protein BJY00DRAFT_224344 [Aspergillus carlsbadensis]